MFDSSALLCFLLGENGADVVEQGLDASSVCSAANWSEVAQKVLARAQDWSLARGLLLSYGMAVEPVLAVDAELAAHRWRIGSGLSLADRICIATADRLRAEAWTADTAWGVSERIKQIR